MPPPPSMSPRRTTSAWLGACVASALAWGPAVPMAAGGPEAPPSVGALEGEAALDREILALVGRPNVCVIDARAEAFFRRGHVPGAISLPRARMHEVLDARLGQLRSEVFDTWVVYCTDARCDDSHAVAAALRAQGFSPVFVYSAGWAGWIAAGGAAERAAPAAAGAQSHGDGG